MHAQRIESRVFDEFSSVCFMVFFFFSIHFSLCWNSNSIETHTYIYISFSIYLYGAFTAFNFSLILTHGARASHSLNTISISHSIFVLLLYSTISTELPSLGLQEGATPPSSH